MLNAVEIKGLAKQYQGFRLHDVDITVPTGHITGLVGANGAGKSTLVKLILNVVHKEAGTITVFGRDNERDEKEIKERIGFVHETPPFYDHMSPLAFGNVVGPFYRRWNSAKYVTLLAEFELPSRKPIRTFSRGMKMKVALAFALAHDADLLLLDEPTSGLDPVFRRELLERLLDFLDDEKSVLFSTHITTDLERVADFLVYLQQGSVLFSESTEVIKARWLLVKGGNQLLTEDHRRFFKALHKGPFGFTALTDRPNEARQLFGGTQTVFERPTLSELIYYFEGGGDHG